MLQETLAIVGGITILTAAYSAAQFTWSFVRPSRLHIYHNSNDKNWAVITGASDGIGKAFARTLLTRDFDVLLHGRNKTKLETLQRALAADFPQRGIEIVVADASKFDDSYMNVVEKVRNLSGDVSILVNNVGGIHNTPGYAAHGETAHGDIDNVINTNVRFGTHLTREMIPVLSKTPRALVVHLGSVAGINGVPYIATYSGTKGFIHSFNDAMKTEMVALGIDNVDFCGFIVGNTSSATNTHPMPFTVTSLQCAASCLDQVGPNSESLLYAHWQNVPPALMVGYMPRGMMRRLMASEVQKRYDAERKGQ